MPRQAGDAFLSPVCPICFANCSRKDRCPRPSFPVPTEYHTLKAKRDAWELASATFTTLLTIVTAVTVAGSHGCALDRLVACPGFEKASTSWPDDALTQVMFLPDLYQSGGLAMGI